MNLYVKFSVKQQLPISEETNIISGTNENIYLWSSMAHRAFIVCYITEKL